MSPNGRSTRQLAACVPGTRNSPVALVTKAVLAQFRGGPLDGLLKVVEDLPEIRFPMYSAPMVHNPQPSGDFPVVDYAVAVYERGRYDLRTYAVGKCELIYNYKPERQRHS